MTEKQFNDLSSLASYLPSRRSGRPRDMIAPGPSEAQIEEIVTIALRTPDHGKLAPWRVIAVGDDQRSLFANGIHNAYLKERPEAGRMELESLESMACLAPTLLVVMCSPVTSTKIPLWEQELSCGAFVMNILHAAHAMGFVGGWITGWPAFNDDVRDLFGSAPERIAGFLYFGTSNAELVERPRPALEDVLSRWTPALSE
ncbi:nitroreductase family protein [Parasphingorhabdus flavimaris]|uniref:Putative NAD(P)H nitroreductase n=1 Tax=Parasphingorhabdus flavimaris TaxID=266812 RepID=A0ABX2N0D6_9SPHN|nr:nitroreductase [Parasphingorhabdus flavimaris]NVD27147.1 nitroreductase [Parasphingorhabdus flavimaris]